MRISDWSSDVCSSDLTTERQAVAVLIDRLQADALDHRQLFGALERTVLFPVRNDRLGLGGADVDLDAVDEIGSASCRERVCQYGYVSGVAVSLKQKTRARTVGENRVSATYTL